MANPAYQVLLVSLSALTAAGLVYVSVLDLVSPPGGVEVIGFVTGLAIMWFLDVSSSETARARTGHPDRILTVDVTREFQDASISLLEQSVDSRPEPDWLARQLLDSDPALALAQLRIELERVLRSLYAEVEKSDQWRGIRMGVDSLVRQEVLPTDIAIPINQVVSVCNQAVHGAEVPRDIALDVVTHGERLLGVLHKLQSNRTAPRSSPRDRSPTE